MREASHGDGRVSQAPRDICPSSQIQGSSFDSRTLQEEDLHKNTCTKQIHIRVTASGKRKEFVKVYDHSDSSSWEFEESDADVVCKEKPLDDSAIVVDEDQMADQFSSATSLIFSSTGASSAGSSKRARLSGGEVLHDSKEHDMSKEERELRTTQVKEEEKLDENHTHTCPESFCM